MKKSKKVKVPKSKETVVDLAKRKGATIITATSIEDVVAEIDKLITTNN